MELTGATSPQAGNLAALATANQNSQADKNETAKPARNESETQQVKLNQANTENRPTPGAATGSVINTSA